MQDRKKDRLKWKRLEDIVDKMIEKGFEKHLLDPLKSEMNSHPLGNNQLRTVSKLNTARCRH